MKMSTFCAVPARHYAEIRVVGSSFFLFFFFISPSCGSRFQGGFLKITILFFNSCLKEFTFSSLPPPSKCHRLLLLAEGCVPTMFGLFTVSV